jgi:hypothetical protein
MATKKLDVLQSDSMRSLVGNINSMGIQKEDIVTIIQDARTDEFTLLYYK